MKWIKVEDELPSYDQQVLVLGEKTGASPSMGGVYHCISKRVNAVTLSKRGVRNHWDENGFIQMKYVTHWMPLPKKPINKG